ncbi:MAG: tetratricopeptide repeat protein [Cytophagaceae bacterium]
MNTSRQQQFSNLLNLAQSSHQKGDLEMAVKLYRESLKIIKDQPDALHLMGIALSSRGKQEQAIESINKALAVSPQNPNFLVNLAEVYLNAQKFQEAFETAQKAIEIQPDFAEAYHKQANAFRCVGNMEGAVKLYNKTLELNPKHFLALFNLGNAMLEMGNFSSAIRYYQESIAINPNYPFAHNNLGIALQEWDRLDEALVHYGKALQLKPDLKEAVRNTAILYDKQGRHDEAKQFYVHLIRLNPDNKALRLQVDSASEAIYSDNAEIDTYRTALKNKLSEYSPDDFTGLSELIEYGVYPPSELIYQGRDDKDLKEGFASLFSKIKSAVVSHKNSKPHIGFVVTSGHEGVFIKCMRGIINNLDTNLFDISIVCSLPNGEKILRPVIDNPGIKFISLPKDFNRALDFLIKAQIDILHYWEIGTDVVNYFLALCKPAKIQCCSWGWPATSGMAIVDYFISSKHLETDEGEKFYTEKLIKFDRLPVYYYKPPVPSVLKPLSFYNLPEGKNVYLCQQNLKKVHPDFDQAVRGVLERDPNGIVVFIEDKQQAITAKLKGRIEASVGQNSGMVFFVKRMEEVDYLGLLAQSAVALDTFHYGGGANTTYDAFEAGVPVITMPTDMHKGRYAYASYKQMEIDGCIAESIEEFIVIAVNIANNPELRKSIVEKIKSKQTEIFEDQLVVKELSDFFWRIFKES